MSLRVKTALTVNRPVAEVYARWTDFERLPEFLGHLESVRRVSEGRSHWVAKGPARLEWDAIVTEEVPKRYVAWQSVDGGVHQAGSARFRPAHGGRGTQLTVELDYEQADGPLRAAVSTMLGDDPAWQLRDDLHRFKEIVETTDGHRPS
jgi:uncharacterized membrane protein